MIYCLEDDAQIRELVVYALGASGFEARGFEKPSELFEALGERLAELLILDVMLPEMDGLKVLSKLRSARRTERLPVIMLTAKGSEIDRVTGLDLGADDYVAKPFGVAELISRVKALLRRSGADEKKTIRRGAVELNPERFSVSVRGEPVELTKKEFLLLEALLRADGRCITRETLLVDIWGYEYTGETRTVDMHIKTLRQKLGEPELIATVRGVGYKIGGGE